MQALASRRSGAAARLRASRLTPHLLLLFTYLIWSVNPVLVKIGLEHVHPLPFVAVRFTIGGLMLMAIAAITRRAIWPPPPLRVLLPTALIGIVANQLGFTYSVQLTTVVNLSILMGLSPMLATGLLIVVAHRRPPGRRLAALLIGFAGVVRVVAAPARGAGGSLLGDAIALVTPVTWAVYLVLAADAIRRHGALVLMAWTMVIGAACFWPMAGVDVALQGLGGSWMDALGPVFFAGLVSSGLGYGLYFWALPRLGVTETAMYSYLQPPMGAG
ncbi:MAG: DMT family transporter, partial [Candidatus Dormibacteraceae bacterium]